MGRVRLEHGCYGRRWQHLPELHRYDDQSMHEHSVRLIMEAHVRLREVIAFLASDLDVQIMACKRFGGLDIFAYNGQRAMEMLREFGAQPLFHTSLWAELWTFTDEVVASYESGEGPTSDARELAIARWGSIREKAGHLLSSIPEPFEEDDVAALVRSERT